VCVRVCVCVCVCAYVCGRVCVQNYHRALDHRSYNFKMEDKKGLTCKGIVCACVCVYASLCVYVCRSNACVCL